MWNYKLIPFEYTPGCQNILLEIAPLLENSQHVFFHPILIDSWLKTYTPIRKLNCYIIEATTLDNTAALPIVLWHRNWKNAFINTIVPIGYSDFDYHDPVFKIIPEKEQLKSFWEGLLIFLKRELKFDSITIDGILDNFAVGSEWRQNEICPQLILNDINSEEDLMAFFKTSLRGDIRRQIRRLSEIGELKFKEYSSWEDIPENTFAEFIRQHSARWPNAYKAPGFHENILRDGLRTGIVHFSTLSVDDNEIAWHLGFSYKGRYYYYMPAGNQAYFKYSPVKIHLFYLIRRAIEKNYEVFDHLRGEENYKSGWSNDEKYVNSISVSSSSNITKLKNAFMKFRITPPLNIK